MKKILVTTDFSPNSKAGLRFAIQLASQGDYDLTFFHSYHIVRSSGSENQIFETFEKSEITTIKRRLYRFVESVYKKMDIITPNINCVIRNSFLTDSNIMQYAAQNGYSFICISRRGNAKHKRIFGTNTANLINQSEVPVIAVPNTYKKNQITKVLYASDLSNLEKEVKKVTDFAKPLKAKVELLHFKGSSDLLEDQMLIEKAIRKFSNHDMELHFEKLDFAQTLIANLEKAIKKSNPSVIIMFTQQNKSFFKRLFLSSNSAEYSFKSIVPLLVFPKV